MPARTGRTSIGPSDNRFDDLFSSGGAGEGGNVSWTDCDQAALTALLGAAEAAGGSVQFSRTKAADSLYLRLFISGRPLERYYTSADAASTGCHELAVLIYERVSR